MFQSGLSNTSGFQWLHDDERTAIGKHHRHQIVADSLVTCHSRRISPESKWKRAHTDVYLSARCQGIKSRFVSSIKYVLYPCVAPPIRTSTACTFARLSPIRIQNPERHLQMGFKEQMERRYCIWLYRNLAGYGFASASAVRSMLCASTSSGCTI